MCKIEKGKKNMNKGLDLIQRQQIEIIDGYPTGNIFIGVTREELTELEIELKEYEQYKAIEEEFGIDLFTLFHLLKGRDVYFKYPHREEIFCDIPYVNLNGMRRDKYFFEASAMFVTDSHSYSFKDYGKTWALTREELERKEKIKDYGIKV